MNCQIRIRKARNARRPRPLSCYAKDHGVLLTERVQTSSVRLCSPANTKLRRLKVPE